MGKTLELRNVPGLPADEIVVIKKLGYSGLTKLRSKSALATIDTDTGKSHMSVDTGQYQKWLLIYGTKEASFFKDCKTSEEKDIAFEREEISTETGDFVYKALTKFNNFEGLEAQKKNLNSH